MLFPIPGQIIITQTPCVSATADDDPPHEYLIAWDDPELRLMGLARTCPWRDPCGCSMAMCHRDGRVRDLYRDCRGCMERQIYRSLDVTD
jgi:hypothetical protein